MCGMPSQGSCRRVVVTVKVAAPLAPVHDGTAIIFSCAAVIKLGHEVSHGEACADPWLAIGVRTVTEPPQK
jgi:hypothetical protein